jgi:hypothetical protein
MGKSRTTKSFPLDNIALAIVNPPPPKLQLTQSRKPIFMLLSKAKFSFFFALKFQK